MDEDQDHIVQIDEIGKKLQDVQLDAPESFVCIDWQRYVTLVEGDYKLNIYINNTLTAETQFNLR